eukprot:6304480-Prorocentrum_lima.AAC.1
MRGTGVPGASRRRQNPDRGMIHMLAYASDDPRQRGYSYQNRDQAEIYVDARLLIEMGRGRLFAASSGVILYDSPIPWQAFAAVRWRFGGA